MLALKDPHPFGVLKKIAFYGKQSKALLFPELPTQLTKPISYLAESGWKQIRRQSQDSPEDQTHEAVSRAGHVTSQESTLVRSSAL